MLRLVIIGLLVAGALGTAPVFADSKSGGGTIGRGCTLDPFNHTQRCIDFDHCTIDKNGKRTCPVVVTTTRNMADAKSKGSKSSSGKADSHPSEYLVFTFVLVLVSS
jgi:hypothetical protein